MKTNPMLEELWQVKDDLAREAGYEPRRFFENLRQWAAEHPHPGPVVSGPGEVRQLAEAQESQRAEAAAMALNDQPARTPPGR